MLIVHFKNNFYFLLHLVTDATLKKDVPKGQNSLRVKSSGPSCPPPSLWYYLHLSLMRRRQKAGLSRPSEHTDPAASTQKPLSLIMPPIKAKTSQFDAVHCSLCNQKSAELHHKASRHVRSLYFFYILNTMKSGV